MMTRPKLPPLALSAAMLLTPGMVFAWGESADDHPANSAQPMTELAPARGIPAYDGDSESVKRDMVAPDATESDEDDFARRPQEDPRLKKYREGFTQAEVALLTRQRVPVAMHSGASGKMRAAAYGAEGTMRRISEDFTAVANVEYLRTDYAFAGSPAPAWRDTDTCRGALHLDGSMDGRFGLFATALLRAGAEDGASLGSGVTALVAAGGRYRFTPEFTVRLGLLTMTRLDADALIAPMAAFDYRTGKWTLSTMNGLVAKYDVFGDNSLVLGASALFETSDIRLRPETGTGRRRSVQFQEVPLTFSATRSLGEHAFVKLATSVIVWSDYRFRTDKSVSGDFQTDPGVQFELSAGARF